MIILIIQQHCIIRVKLTNQVPFPVSDVSGNIGLHHLQVQRPSAVRPRAELQITPLNIKREPAHIDVAGALKDTLTTEALWEMLSLPSFVPTTDHKQMNQTQQNQIIQTKLIKQKRAKHTLELKTDKSNTTEAKRIKHNRIKQNQTQPNQTIQTK